MKMSPSPPPSGDLPADKKKTDYNRVVAQNAAHRKRSAPSRAALHYIGRTTVFALVVSR